MQRRLFLGVSFTSLISLPLAANAFAEFSRFGEQQVLSAGETQGLAFQGDATQPTSSPTFVPPNVCSGSFSAVTSLGGLCPVYSTTSPTCSFNEECAVQSVTPTITNFVITNTTIIPNFAYNSTVYPSFTNSSTSFYDAKLSCPNMIQPSNCTTNSTISPQNMTFLLNTSMTYDPIFEFRGPNSYAVSYTIPSFYSACFYVNENHTCYIQANPKEHVTFSKLCFINETCHITGSVPVYPPQQQDGIQYNKEIPGFMLDFSYFENSIPNNCTAPNITGLNLPPAPPHVGKCAFGPCLSIYIEVFTTGAPVNMTSGTFCPSIPTSSPSSPPTPSPSFGYSVIMGTQTWAATIIALVLAFILL